MPNISKIKPSKKKAIIAGHFCLDILPDLSNVPEGEFFNLFLPGHLLESGEMNIATGGAASNTGISLNKLGVPATIIARVGQDGFGKMAQEHLEKFVQSDHIQLNHVEGETTSYTVIVNPPGVDRIFLHHPGANDSFTGQNIDFSVYKDHVLFHFGYPQLMKEMFFDGGRRMSSMYRRAKELGFTTSLDTTFPDPSSEMGQVDWEKVLKETLPFVDIFSPSFEEAFFMLDKRKYSQFVEGNSRKISPDLILPLLEKILEFGSKIAFIKLGELGAILGCGPKILEEEFGRAWYPQLSEWKNKWMWIPSFKVKVAGTTGAGDATIAGLLASILNEMPLEESLLMAMGVGGCNVEAIDSVSSVLSWSDTATRINLGWEQNNLSLENYPDWLWNPVFLIWEKQVQ